MVPFSSEYVRDVLIFNSSQRLEPAGQGHDVPGRVVLIAGAVPPGDGAGIEDGVGHGHYAVVGIVGERQAFKFNRLSKNWGVLQFCNFVAQIIIISVWI